MSRIHKDTIIDPHMHIITHLK